MNELAVALAAQSLEKTYVQGEQQIRVLRETNITVYAGELVAVTGRSGSGKSTLLHILAGLDTPDSGSVVIEGVDLVSANNNKRAALRANHMGFVYQNHHLLPEFRAWENVAMPMRIAGLGKVESRKRAVTLLAEIGLEERLDHFPAQLSGGERQRVAVARAVAGEPRIVLADEPTGNLDRQNADDTLALIRRLAKVGNTAFLVVTHDESSLSGFDRALRLEAGQLSAS